MSLRNHMALPIETVRVPLAQSLASELLVFWKDIFGSVDCLLAQTLQGDEAPFNVDTIYLMRDCGQLAGTAHLTVSVDAPEVGGLGEVATAAKYRGRGIATHLCRKVWGDFVSCGGRALFLGTYNPAARSVYQKSGWQELPSSHIMVRLTENDSTENLFTDYFSPGRTTTIQPTTASARIPMIPLIVAPHSGRLLDANVGILSTGYAVQTSCMGLYPKYDRACANGQGTWFSVWTDHGHLVGLATATVNAADACLVDGFVHEAFDETWPALMKAAIQWGEQRGIEHFVTSVACHDQKKRERYSVLGFRKTEEVYDAEISQHKILCADMAYVR